MNRLHFAGLLGTAVLLLAALQLRSPQQWAQPAVNGPAQIHLNGRPLAKATVVARQGVYVNVADLMNAIDGNARGPRRLQLSGSSLYAIELGACPGCAVAVSRAVRLSNGVRWISGAAHLPLADLLRAFEARADTNASLGSYNIYVGTCQWCILIPLEK